MNESREENVKRENIEEQYRVLIHLKKSLLLYIFEQFVFFSQNKFLLKQTVSGFSHTVYLGDNIIHKGFAQLVEKVGNFSQHAFLYPFNRNNYLIPFSLQDCLYRVFQAVVLAICY